MRTNHSRKSLFKSSFQTLESRQLMAAATPAINTGGPIHEMVESGGQVFVSSPIASGATTAQIWVSDGTSKKTRLLVDWSTGNNPYSFEDLSVTTQGIYFTAVGGDGNGRQLYKVNTKKGGAVQITNIKDAWFGRVFEAGGKQFVYDKHHTKIQLLNADNTLTDVATVDILVNTIRVANNKLFFLATDRELWRSDGTPQTTARIAGDGANNMEVSDIFVAGDYLYYELSDAKSTFWRTDGIVANTMKIAEEFRIDDGTSAQVGDWIYFGGGYYNTAGQGNALSELYRVHNQTGQLELVSDTNKSGSGGAKNVSAVGTSIYFVAADGEFVASQGTHDVELFRHDTVTGKTTLVTKNNQLYPVEMGGKALSSYYFVAAPTKDDARWGSRALYRTNPLTDEVEQVQGLPTVLNSNQKPYQSVTRVASGSRGFFFVAVTGYNGSDTDVFFVTTPFSRLANNGTLTIDATVGSDTLKVDVVGAEVVLTMNGVEERHALSAVKRIEAFLGDGDDRFESTQNVTQSMYVFGDLGNDYIQTGAGNDTVTGGAGRNEIYGGDGADRLNGGNSRDHIDGQEGADRLYGKGHNDHLIGGGGVDRLYGDIGDDLLDGSSSNDKLYGEQGNDTLRGGRHDDLLVGGAGDDSLEGNDGNDMLIGDAGADIFFGGKGIDTARWQDDDAATDLIEALV